MNCERLRETLYDYLDDTLSPAEKASAEKHLLECNACRQELHQEVLLAQALSNRLGRAVETVALDANARRQMATAVQRKIAKPSERFSIIFWSRLAMPVAVSGLILVGVICTRHRSFTGDSNLNLFAPLTTSDRAVPIHDSYTVPAYTFHRQGDLVIDALTVDTRSLDGALLVKR